MDMPPSTANWLGQSRYRALSTSSSNFLSNNSRFLANFYLFHHNYPLIDTLASISSPVKPVIQKNHRFIAVRVLLTIANSTWAIYQ